MRAVSGTILSVLFWGFGIGQVLAGDRFDPPRGVGQLETAPKLFTAGTDKEGREYFLNGQQSRDGLLILTASNGFFTPRTCRAEGTSDLPKSGDKDLISPNFAYLDEWKSSDGTIRWHLWLAEPGEVRFALFLAVDEKEAGSELRVSFAGQERTVTTVASTDSKAQPWNLAFTVKEPGEQTFAISAKALANATSGVGKLHSASVWGDALANAQLLRARWRPAAVHGSYGSTSCKQSRLWVMTTTSTRDVGNYSPITTPFGYYGTSFDADQRSNGSFNFSMWAAGQGKKEVPPLEHMPHLLAAGSRSAEFSGFGHEGSGVKLRGWIPMPDRPRVVVQALRAENDGDYHTFFGYFWDHPSSQWKLYAVGREWSGGKPLAHLRPGSFCEVPGPPDRERTGDLVREVRRRGWFLDEKRKWHPMDQFLVKSSGVRNAFWSVSKDGEFVMGTGGMRHYRFEQPSDIESTGSLPEFLGKTATAQLFKLPVEFGVSRAEKITTTSADVEIVLKRAGKNAAGVFYYGEIDCLTFAPRALHGTERRSEISQATQDKDRSWQHSVTVHSLQDGRNTVQLRGLRPSTTYFYRVLVRNDEGQVWAFDSGRFQTKRD